MLSVILIKAHLRQSDHEEVRGLLVVELCEVAEHACQASVVGAAADQAHGKDGVTCHRGVTVMGELAQRVQDGQLWVGGGEQGQCQRHSTPDHGVSIVKLRKHNKRTTNKLSNNKQITSIKLTNKHQINK